MAKLYANAELPLEASCLERMTPEMAMAAAPSVSLAQHSFGESLALHQRNQQWRNNPYIPTWVDPNEVGLDQFFTRPEVAQDCYASLRQWMHQDGARPEEYHFIEPAAGIGAFFDLLPTDRRVGIDIAAYRDEYERTDFLSWQPAEELRYALIGNPPFGYRAWLALAFMNHAAKFADYVGMILPMAFQSDGKGGPKLRVRGLRLVHTQHLPQNAFVDVQGRRAKVNALWQVWQRGVNNTRLPATCDQWLDLFTVDNRKERLCGQRRIAEADFFLQRTFYGKAPTLVRDFADVRYVCGYGLILKREKRRVAKLLNQTDWCKYSNLAAHNCRHISMYHIRQVLTDAGLQDA